QLPERRLALGRPPLLPHLPHLLGATLRVAAEALAVSLGLARVPLLGGHSRQRSGSRKGACSRAGRSGTRWSTPLREEFAYHRSWTSHGPRVYLRRSSGSPTPK